MAGKPMELYLNDHLGGSTLGADLAKRIRDRSEGTALGSVMDGIATEIAEDRDVLQDLMDRLGITRNPVKQVTGWAAEKASRVKFSGASSGEPDHGLFMALETLRLGVAGKECLWRTLREVRGDYAELADVDFDRLIERASSQQLILEAERVKAGTQVLRSQVM
jgi:hypothetical protein